MAPALMHLAVALPDVAASRKLLKEKSLHQPQTTDASKNMILPQRGIAILHVCVCGRQWLQTFREPPGSRLAPTRRPPPGSRRPPPAHLAHSRQQLPTAGHRGPQQAEARAPPWAWALWAQLGPYGALCEPTVPLC